MNHLSKEALEQFRVMSDCFEIQDVADDFWDEFSIACWHAPNHVQCKGHFSDWHMAYKFCPVCSKELKITPEYSICCRMKGDDSIWLPTQAQLQGMAGIVNPTDLMARLTQFFYKWDGLSVLGVCVYCEQFLSMEALLEAFVMKELYNKVWDNAKKEWRNG